MNILDIFKGSIWMYSEQAGHANVRMMLNVTEHLELCIRIMFLS